MFSQQIQVDALPGGRERLEINDQSNPGNNGHIVLKRVLQELKIRGGMNPRGDLVVVIQLRAPEITNIQTHGGCQVFYVVSDTAVPPGNSHPIVQARSQHAVCLERAKGTPVRETGVVIGQGPAKQDMDILLVTPLPEDLVQVGGDVSGFLFSLLRDKQGQVDLEPRILS